MRPLPVATLAALLLGPGFASAEPAQEQIVEGVIAGYQCGDNCYLTIKEAGGKERTGLCTAPLCRSWNENVTMPEKFKGKKARVWVGKGPQYDAEGRVAGEMETFSRIQLR